MAGRAYQKVKICYTGNSGGISEDVLKISSYLRGITLKGMDPVKIDCGNYFDLRNRYTSLLGGEAEKGFSSLAKYDFMLPSFRDFFLGVNKLLEFSNTGGLPYSCCNLVNKYSGKTIFNPWIIRNTGKNRIGIFGVLFESIVTGLPNGSLGDSYLAGPRTSASRAVYLLKQHKVDIIICVVAGTNEEVRRFAQHSEADITLFADFDMIPSEPEYRGNTILAGTPGTALSGQIDMVLSNGNIRNLETSNIILEDQGVLPEIERAWNFISARYRNKEAHTLARFYKRFSRDSNFAGTNESSRLIANAGCALLNTEIFIFQKEVLPGYFWKGIFSNKDLMMIMPRDIYLVERSVLGAHLRKALEKSFFNVQIADHLRLYTGGITFSAVGEHIGDLEWHGMGFDENRTYKVTMPYIDEAFDLTYPGLVSSPLIRVLPSTLRSITASWLKKKKEF